MYEYIDASNYKSGVNFDTFKHGFVQPLTELLRLIQGSNFLFDLDDDSSGFHDFDINDNNNIIRGYFSTIKTFNMDVVEVFPPSTLNEKPKRGVVKRGLTSVETAQFVITKDYLFIWENGKPKKDCRDMLKVLSPDINLETLRFDVDKFFKSIDAKEVVMDSDEDNIRTIKLSGKLSDVAINTINDGRLINATGTYMFQEMGSLTVRLTKDGKLNLCKTKTILSIYELENFIRAFCL